MTWPSATALDGAAAELADAMVEQRYDVLIGTQIVAKGHHFPKLTLVGVDDGVREHRLAVRGQARFFLRPQSTSILA